MKKITFFEYSDVSVANGRVRAKLCHTTGDTDNHRMFAKLVMAERVYEIVNNVVVVIKDRNGTNGTAYHISDEDLVVLKLKSVLLQ